MLPVLWAQRPALRPLEAAPKVGAKGIKYALLKICRSTPFEGSFDPWPKILNSAKTRRRQYSTKASGALISIPWPAKQP